MFAAFHLPAFPMAAVLRARPTLAAQPCAIMGNGEGKRERDQANLPLLAINHAAQIAGLASGWPLNRALVRCPDLLICPREYEQETDLSEELLSLAESVSADCERTAADLVIVDLAQVPETRRRTLGVLEMLDVEVWRATAATPDLAHFAVLHGDAGSKLLTPDDIASLPIASLEHVAEGETFLLLLDLWGLNTLGDFLRLPRQALAERLGPRAGHWHDVLHGKTCRLLKLHRAPASFAQSYEFEEAIGTLEPLIFVLKRLLHTLAGKLAFRHLAAGSLSLTIALESGDIWQRDVRLPEPLTDGNDMLCPLQTLLDALRLNSAIKGVKLDAEVARPIAAQREWYGRQLPQPERWSETLARLEALVGSDRVGIPAPSVDHRPDHFLLHRAPTGTTESPVTMMKEEARLPACSVPMRRYRPPVPVKVAAEMSGRVPVPHALLTGPEAGAIVDFHGPYARSGHWWESSTAWQRLEWDIQLDNHRLLRLAFLPPEQWQLEGAYG